MPAKKSVAAYVTISYDEKKHGSLDRQIRQAVRGWMRPTVGSTTNGKRQLTLRFSSHRSADRAGAVLEKKFDHATVVLSAPALLNWPPSRGPMPAWMRKRPKGIVPAIKVEIKQRPKHKAPTLQQGVEVEPTPAAPSASSGAR